MLKTIIGLGTTLEDSISAALDEYNKETDEIRTLHHTDMQERFLPEGEVDPNTEIYIEHLCIIWYTVRKPVQQEPEYKYIGSEEIDPNDPDWLRKWNDAQNASVTSPEGTGATEGKDLGSDTE